MIAEDVPNGVVERFPTTSAQTRLWLQEQARPGDPEFNISVRWEIRGKFRIADVETAFRKIIERHEILRTRFLSDCGEPFQEVVERVDFRMGVVDIRTIAPAQHEARVDPISRELAGRAFDLSVPCQFRVTLVSLAPDRAAILICAHHLVFDGFSISVLGHEFGTIMQALNERAPVSLEELPLQFGDYALWEKEMLDSGALEESGLYWENNLSDANYLEIKPDYPYPTEHNARGRNITFPFPADFNSRMADFCKEHKVSLFTFGAAVFGATLHNWTGDTDIVFSSPVAGRVDLETEKLIGVFINTVVLRMNVGSQQRFSDHLVDAKNVVQKSLEHQAYPFDAVVRRIRCRRTPGRPLIASVGFNMQRIFLKERSYGDLQLVSVPSHMPGISFDMNVQISGRNTGWALSVDYNEHIFRAETAQQFGRTLLSAFEFFISNPQSNVADISPEVMTEASALPVTEAAVETDPDTRQTLDAEPQQADDAIQGDLRVIWSEVLGLPASACDGDFFELGGYSLQAVRMIARAEKRFGVRPPLAVFLTDPTLSGYAGAIDKALRASKASLVALPLDGDGWDSLALSQPMHGAPVIVTVNQPFLYRSIAESLSSECEVINLYIGSQYSFDALKGKDFDAVAARAARAVKRRFSGRPMLVLGHCVDALVALRMGQILADAGERLITVGMIDCWAPGTVPPVKGRRLRRWSHYLLQRARGRIGWKDLLLKNRAATRLLRKLGRAEEETEFEALSREVNHHLVDLARSFRFDPYAGEVVLFRTDAQIPEADKRMFGWSGILAEDTPIYRLKGWHEDALLWSGHERIAQVIDSKIARIERLVSAEKTAVARVD